MKVCFKNIAAGGIFLLMAAAGLAGCKAKVYTFHESVTALPAGTDGTIGTNGTYVLFGDWPQTIKEAKVKVNEKESMTTGSHTYYKGSDGNWYAKVLENGFEDYEDEESMPKYSDGTTVAAANPDAPNYLYFKVEPIKWRVITDNYDGKKLLLSENILTSNIPYYPSKSARTLGKKTVWANNYKYSNVRAYLNGTANQFVLDGGKADDNMSDWSGRGFLQSAFTESAQNLITATNVDNSSSSTGDADGKDKRTTRYACEDTEDKIFLMSEREMTNRDYGFPPYDSAGAGNPRIRMASDYALANHVVQPDSDIDSDILGGGWYIRSPSYIDSFRVRGINCDGDAAVTGEDCDGCIGGICPALAISF